MEGSFVELQDRVIQRGLCTACGTCAGVCPEGAIGWSNEDDEPLPELKGNCTGCGICNTVCPGEEVNIPALEQFVFGRTREENIPDLGLYLDALAGWAADEAIRQRGAGGGLVTALLAYALEKGFIDCALVSGFRRDQPWRTQAKLAVNRQQLLAAAQSKYACVPVNTLLRKAFAEGYRRVAVVGLPCHIHGLRKMQFCGRPASLARGVVLMVGLFCASQFYFEGTRHLLVERLGVDRLEDVSSLSYRGGHWPGHLVVELKDGRKLLLDRHEYMYHHLMPGYKRDRCEMCVDWAAELADLSVGDYWDPRVRAGQALGISSCLVRSRAGKELLEGAVKEGYVETIPLEAARLAAGIGYELKKHAAAFRLKQRRRFGWPVPEYHRQTNYTPFARELHLAPETKSDVEK
jgi:coenzyme F420 hydrogenase subunit beta